MEKLLVIVPIVISIGQCIVSGCLFRRISSRISFIEEMMNTYPKPQPPQPQVYPQAYPQAYPQSYPQPSAPRYYAEGYGYPYSGGQGNIANGNLNIV